MGLIEILKKIKIYANKVPAIIMLFVFPTEKVTNMFFSFSLAIIKITSAVRAGYATQLYEYYFKYVLDAKRKNESISIVPKIDILGDVIEFAQVGQKLSLALTMINYLVLPVLLPILFYSFFKNDIPLAIKLTGFVVTYYSLVFFYTVYMILTTKLKQSTLKSFLYSELNYVYAKTSEIDEEVAQIAMTQIKDSLLLENEKNLKPKQTELKKIIGVK